jgi:hypothetical protein
MKARRIAALVTLGVALLSRPLLAGESDSKGAGAPAGVQEKLKALEAAHKAGILTKAEYERKKAEFLRAAKPQPDEATEQELKALDAAHKAGTLSDAEYARKKAELTGQAPPPAREDVAEPPVAPARGELYRHPTGLSFRYPQGWTVKRSAGTETLLLIPPNPAMRRRAPTELYFLLAEKVAEEGGQSIDDPRVSEYLDAQIRSVSAALQRVGPPGAINLAETKGIVVDWHVRSPRGDGRGARAFAAIIKGYRVTLIALGLKERLAARDAALRQIFSSFEAGEPQQGQPQGQRPAGPRDRRLVAGCRPSLDGSEA